MFHGIIRRLPDELKAKNIPAIAVALLGLADGGISRLRKRCFVAGLLASD